MAHGCARRWPGASILAACACLLAGACTPATSADPAGGPLLPQLASRQDHVDRLQLRGAGNKTQVTLQRVGGEWRLAQRAGWRADGARIGQYLLQLAQARRAEAKTDSVVMYPRLGLEDVSDPQAGGTELELSGKDIAARLVLGEPHKVTGGRFVRVAGDARAWLSDLDVGFDADPVAWLDHRLLSVPLARVLRVRVRPRTSAAFALVSRDDRFRPDDAPSGAMRDSHAGDAIASALEALDVEDVAADVPSRVASQSLDYELVDGAVVTVAVFRDGQRDWARVGASFDEAQGQSWARQAGRPALEDEARARVLDWSRRFEGRRFLLSEQLARTLTLDHSQILDGEAAP